ncbi:MAG TPA: hypothetical protein P5159_16915 [Phycisphaerae bacterium]|nr:hypothetical protein [Phycisphaerae bacterium]
MALQQEYAAVLRKRRELADTIDAAERALSKDLPRLTSAVRDAEAEVTRARNTLETATAHLSEARRNLAIIGSRRDAVVSKAQAQLRETADVTITEAVAKLDAMERAALSRPIETQKQLRPRRLGFKVLPAIVDNKRSIEAHLNAIRRVREAILRMTIDGRLDPRPVIPGMLKEIPAITDVNAEDFDKVPVRVPELEREERNRDPREPRK